MFVDGTIARTYRLREDGVGRSSPLRRRDDRNARLFERMVMQKSPPRSRGRDFVSKYEASVSLFCWQIYAYFGKIQIFMTKKRKNAHWPLSGCRGFVTAVKTAGRRCALAATQRPSRMRSGRRIIVGTSAKKPLSPGWAVGARKGICPRDYSSSRISKILIAAVDIGVPGPKIAAAPSR